MSDADIHRTITDLVQEEHRLRSGEVSAEDRERLSHLEESLDQCWDLLRQRRARREFGQDPDAAQVRDPSTVEHYRQ